MGILTWAGFPGGLQAVAELMHLDQVLYGMQGDPLSMALRRYAGMTLTNLTFGDVVNKVREGEGGTGKEMGLRGL